MKADTWNAIRDGAIVGTFISATVLSFRIDSLKDRVAELEKLKPTPVVVGAASVGETNKTSP